MSLANSRFGGCWVKGVGYWALGLGVDGCMNGLSYILHPTPFTQHPSRYLALDGQRKYNAQLQQVMSRFAKD
jgi:hypothetical protein